METLVFHQFSYSFLNIFDLRQNEIFDLRRVGDKRIGCADAFDGRVQKFKKFVGDSRCDFRALAE